MQTKNILKIVFITGVLLLVPLLAGLPWTLSDFVVAGLLLLGAGLTFNLAMLKFPKQKVVVGVAVILAFVYIWAELAVGIFTNLGS